MGGAVYRIFGKQVQSHYLAIGTLGSLAAVGVAMSVGKKTDTKPMANTSDSNSSNGDIDVEAMISKYLKDEDKE
ncbi:hypothetical protein Kpol_495p9 [Vanderwaltozyma polyspora DSM 70294]|uniref:ATP synthase subunit K, mitochondrial n=1 Tax=Vanderwaltozyma polyspora (strain ATCC 22028 / DSM 70294 / BCRC 21397 / CBS 2163 / NBRC 10782 / NRRL Y-8283 / UCD 57-17) TaxID=436907 RepID=A7TNY6_VANPO|nr:uncharacterized protein Kpol_495p9 [Vanderwaltozyma polyspora DSM 70294]EDO16011.1 hypothetical protein Kpol_495p9 [Vanderwaltozyma polyspora DSM 70294]